MQSDVLASSFLHYISTKGVRWPRMHIEDSMLNIGEVPKKLQLSQYGILIKT